MPRNIEIKAKLENSSIQRKIAETLSNANSTRLEQHDTFFNVPHGRLKLRKHPDGTGDLIFYERPDHSGPTTSTYVLYTTKNPTALLKTLELSLGRGDVVKKTRELFIVGRTRIHIDNVEGLGKFLELEVVLNDSEDVSEGEREAQSLMNKLNITKESLRHLAYVDMLNSNND